MLIRTKNLKQRIPETTVMVLYIVFFKLIYSEIFIEKNEQKMPTMYGK